VIGVEGVGVGASVLSAAGVAAAAAAPFFGAFFYEHVRTVTANGIM
jgi:hypothetical protein